MSLRGITIDNLSNRFILSKEAVLSLPIRVVSEDELYKLKESWYYNPSVIFDYSLGEDVVGHDLKFRYKLKNKEQCMNEIQFELYQVFIVDESATPLNRFILRGTFNNIEEAVDLYHNELRINNKAILTKLVTYETKITDISESK